MQSGIAALSLVAFCAVVAQGTASTLTNITCGRHSYTRAQVNDAVAFGCNLYAAGHELGISRYPHQFKNSEGLAFTAPGPYEEFPILEKGEYSGKSPGADRVIFNPSFNGSCVFVGAITHTDASSHNGFVLCTTESSSGPGSQSSASSSTTLPTASTTAAQTASGASSTSTATHASTNGVELAVAIRRRNLGVVAGALFILLLL